ncbi:hypothetical protein MPSEU_001034400 [Mayamaea pseudoterrestris]|nr:hypothetical protein MPSEU_001034400 [Mayamaea pseudoterrestris]
MGEKLKSMTENTSPSIADQSFADDDDSSSVSETSTSDPSTANPTQKNDSTPDSLTHKETRAVNRSKVLVYVALLIAAIGVGVATYFISHQAQVDDYETAFAKHANDVGIVANNNANNLFGVVRSMATAITSYSQEQEQRWPTLPNFDARATDAKGLAGLEFIAYAPKVAADETTAWETYAQKKQGWIAKDWSYHDVSTDAGSVPSKIYYDGPRGEINENEDADDAVGADEFEMKGVHFPLWQAGPVPHNASVINFDLYQHPAFRDKFNDGIEARKMLISGVVDIDFILERIISHNHTDGEHQDHTSSVIFQPVFDDFTDDANVTGFVLAGVPWQHVLSGILPTGVNGILVQVQVTCGGSFTYMLNGREALYAGKGLLGKANDERHVKSFPFAEVTRFTEDNEQDFDCLYALNVVATESFEQTFFTSGPIVFAFVVAMTFVVTACVFAVYDYTVFRRQAKLLSTAERTNAIVSSLFPKDVRDRIMAEAEEQARQESAKPTKAFGSSAKNQLKAILGEHDHATDTIFKTKPIADLFPDVTIMFADLVGFTAWSSMREPAQVFTLLETLYHEFDQIAQSRRVFKVETVGDCYVAVAGLPDARKDHATVMARFARDCLYKMHVVVRQLEVSLGPDTAELGLRLGLHSGPVTAGVLRGKRARFQLFGDSMNTTARIETTGAKNRIHMSQETADLLIGSGKGHWIRAREDKVQAKGKGELTTYWLEVKGDVAMSRSSATSSSEGGTRNNVAADRETKPVSSSDPGQKTSTDDKALRLVNWNTEVISQMLKDIIARREAIGTVSDTNSNLAELEKQSQILDHTVLEECTDVIKMPSFSSMQHSSTPIKLESVVVQQLHLYVETIAAMYRSNPFHNFEHASHVTMSATKLLSRIAAPDIEISGDGDINSEKILHDHTYGITSSPLTRLAIVWAALIHDVDHTGVPNSLLVEEHASIAAAYKNKSVAEQNSIDIAWDLLMQDTFKDLRRTIYQTEDEFKRFRQLLVNVVLSTDIMDKDLAAKRKARWVLAFDPRASVGSKEELTARKASIVIEHLIQASDVAHTMQHWHVYRKWNARLFEEMYKVWKEGRSAQDPSESWFQGEMGFFDFYIIPLAKKLKDCGVFGVSSDEYLNYAQQNRREWELKGKEIVSEMVEKADAKFSSLLCM